MINTNNSSISSTQDSQLHLKADVTLGCPQLCRIRRNEHLTAENDTNTVLHTEMLTLCTLEDSVQRLKKSQTFTWLLIAILHFLNAIHLASVSSLRYP